MTGILPLNRTLPAQTALLTERFGQHVRLAKAIAQTRKIPKRDVPRIQGDG